MITKIPPLRLIIVGILIQTLIIHSYAYLSFSVDKEVHLEYLIVLDRRITRV